MKSVFVFKYFLMGLMLVGQGSLVAQHIHYTTLHGDCEEVESDPNGCYEQPTCCHHHPNRYQTGRFAEEQFEDTGWPARRDDELSDQLMR